jgi:hypothetical protein
MIQNKNNNSRMIVEQIIRVGAKLAQILFYKIMPKRALSPRAEYWDTFRYRALPIISPILGGILHIDREIREQEFAGVLSMTSDEAEKVLWRNGFHRNPLAAVKTRNGAPEVGSWALREHPDARRQLHIMLFDSQRQKVGVDVYAHEEFSCLNPDVAVRHYRGVDQKPKLGVKQATEMLPVEMPEKDIRK